jgi:hypothetical protein
VDDIGFGGVRRQLDDPLCAAYGVVVFIEMTLHVREVDPGPGEFGSNLHDLLEKHFGFTITFVVNGNLRQQPGRIDVVRIGSQDAAVNGLGLVLFAGFFVRIRLRHISGKALCLPSARVPGNFRHDPLGTIELCTHLAGLGVQRQGSLVGGARRGRPAFDQEKVAQRLLRQGEARIEPECRLQQLPRSLEALERNIGPGRKAQEIPVVRKGGQAPFTGLRRSCCIPVPEERRGTQVGFLLTCCLVNLPASATVRVAQRKYA